MVTKPIPADLYARKIDKHLFAFFIQIFNELHFLIYTSVCMHDIKILIDNDEPIIVFMLFLKTNKLYYFVFKKNYAIY